MKPFKYLMPTQMIFGKGCIKENQHVFSRYGKNAFIVTGKSSAKNGALDDVLSALNANHINYEIFDEVEENPSVENVVQAAEIGKNKSVDFIIAIGGGSPLDAAKAIGILIKHPSCSGADLYGETAYDSIPALSVPTTAGTGSEVTPYAILTTHQEKTKKSLPYQRIFYDIAFLDASYMMGMPDHITVNTALDAFSHLAEGYLSSNANFISDSIALQGIEAFGQCCPALENKSFPLEIREKLLLISSLGGFVISQTGTSLPHMMGYPLTYYHQIPHGMANALLMAAYFNSFKNPFRVNEILKRLGLSQISALSQLTQKLLPSCPSIELQELKGYAKTLGANTSKLKNHPEPVGTNDLCKIYTDSLIR